MDIYEVVMRLVGPIEPVGETHMDDDRYERLKLLTSLVEQLLTDISTIEHDYKNNHQFSMKRASEYCRLFLNAVVADNDYR